MNAINSSISGLVSQITQKKAIDAALPDDVKYLVTAEILKTAGAAIGVTNTSPRKILTALANIERLAQLPEAAIQRGWLALRALDMKQGQKIAGPDLENPVFTQIVALSNLIPTIDPKEAVAGWFGAATDADAERCVGQARTVTMLPFSVTSNGNALFSEGTETASPEQILAAIDRLNQKAAPINSRAIPLVYEALEEPNIVPAEGDTLFADYKLSRVSIPSAKPHPTALVEPAALASVPLPLPTYVPVLDPAYIASGAISDIQLEMVIAAGDAHQSFLPKDPKTGVAQRRGFLVGHGTGVGKGTGTLAIVRDNWNQGRGRSIVFSENQKLYADSERYWVGIGGRPNDLIKQVDFNPKDDIPERNGILFSTYALLRDPVRLAQIVNWFGAGNDGVIVLDECQAGRNAMHNGKDAFSGANQVSLQGEAMIELQETVPNARVVYSSATSAMDIVGLGYATRLGLWGAGTSFPTAGHFFTEMQRGGIGCLELVSRDMKAMGMYVAANLSMNGVRFERLDIRMTDDERNTQDTLSEAWMMVNTKMMATLTRQGVSFTKHIKTSGRGTYGAGRTYAKNLTGIYRQAKSRFFQSLIASIKMRRLIPQLVADMAQGHAPVVQITNTNEASLDRAIKAVTASDNSDLDASPREILLGFLRDSWPIYKLTTTKVNGQTMHVPAVGPNGQRVIDAVAEQERDLIIDQIKQLDIPDNPIDQLLAFFGPDQVAEVTGRSKRVIPGKVAGTREIQERSHADVHNDVAMFQADRKKVLIFSTSGATGASYDANRTVKNQRLRRHYLLQAGWRADQAIQGLGRTHRSFEVQAPEYILVQLDLWADKRMISNVASGMEALGALTRGQRQAASQELFTQEDNLESEHATTAWKRFLEDLKNGKVTGLDIKWFERETGIQVFAPNGALMTDSEMPTIRRFLTAMSGMTCDRQEAFGEAYKKRLEDVRMEAIANGTFDRGVEWIQAESIMKITDDIVWRDPRTGATSRLLQLVKTEKVTPVKYDDARKKAFTYGGNARVAINGMTNRVAMVGFPPQNGNFSLDALDEILVITPRGETKMKRYRFDREIWRQVTPDEAKRIWEIELKQVGSSAETWFHLVTGMLLPIWDRLPKSQSEVYRLETDDGERIIGRLVPDEWAQGFVNRLGNGTVSATESLANLENGGTANLANGWLVYNAFHAMDGNRIELTPLMANESASDWVSELSGMGVIAKEGWGGKWRFRLPSDPEARIDAWEQIVTKWPVVNMTGEKAAA